MKNVLEAVEVFIRAGYLGTMVLWLASWLFGSGWQNPYAGVIAVISLAAFVYGVIKALIEQFQMENEEEDY